MTESSAPFKPAHMCTLSPHLICDGAAEAIAFYQKAFGAEELVRVPGPDGKLLHACVRICGATVMLVDEYPQFGALSPKKLDFSPVTIHIFVEDVDAFVARAVAAGARVMMPVADMFWGDRYGTLVDPFGHRWSVATHLKDMTEAELRQAMQAAMANAPAPGEPGCIASTGDKDAFVISREYDAPRDLVWKSFTEVARLQKWWGPKGVKIVEAKLDLRPGGTFHYCMQMPDGSLVWGRFVYREITAPHRILFVSSFSDPEGGITRHPMAPTWPREMTSRFECTEVGGKTRFTAAWSPLNATTAEKAAFDAGHASMQQGWTGTMDQLGDYLAAVQRPRTKAKAR